MLALFLVLGVVLVTGLIAIPVMEEVYADHKIKHAGKGGHNHGASGGGPKDP